MKVAATRDDGAVLLAEGGQDPLETAYLYDVARGRVYGPYFAGSLLRSGEWGPGGEMPDGALKALKEYRESAAGKAAAEAFRP